MSEEHISRILKMLEEGKISAGEAQTLIAALQSGGRPGGAPPGPPPPPPPPGEGGARGPEVRVEATATDSEGGTTKSFEFRWGQKRGFPLDLSGLSKQISDAVKRLDPERILKEARIDVSKRGRRWQERMKTWSWFGEEEEGPPENTLGYPTARATETLHFGLAYDLIQVQNSWGAIHVQGGANDVRIEIDKEAWALTEEEAASRLHELKVETETYTPETGPSRLEVRVIAPEGWHDGLVNLRLRVPDSSTLRLETIFGEVRVENTAGKTEIHTVSGGVHLENLRGEVRAEGISGNMDAVHISGSLSLATKSGQLRAEDLARGGSVVAVSGDVHVSRVEGGRLEAKSVSGDVIVEHVGLQVPIDATLESVSGDVRLVEAHGNATLKTVSGDATAERLEVTTLQAHTVSGDVKIELSAAFIGTLNTNTVSGDVSVRLPETSNFRFSLGTKSGDLHCEHAARDVNRTETLWVGTVGTGAGTITIHTLSGDVHLGKTE